MKWKIEGSDQSGDDVIVIVEADDVETATKQANFAGVKVKAIHPEEATQPAFKLPPSNSATVPGLATAPPGYTGKVIVEREEDEHHESAATRAVHKISAAAQHLHAPGADTDTIFKIATHILALTLLVIGIVVFLRGWIQYGRVPMPVIVLGEDIQTAIANNGLLSLAWTQSLVYVGHMIIGLLIVIIAILIEGFLTRMIVNIRETWHKK
jgi:hypothetical protein